MRITFVFLSLCILLRGAAQSLFEGAGPAGGEKPERLLDWSGYVRGSAYGGAKLFDYASIFGEAALQGKLNKGKARLFADVRLREGAQFGERHSVLQLKEAYAGYQSAKFDLRLGNQIVAWGRSDAFSPANCITSNDYFLLTPEPDDQTLPNFLLRAKYRFLSAAELELIGIPFFRPSEYRYDLFKLADNVRFVPGLLPETAWKAGAAAARLNFELPGVGFSLAYFTGYDPFYGFTIQNVDMGQPFQPAITYRPDYYRKQMVAADFALPLEKWIIRGETAAKFTRDHAAQMHVPGPDLSWVLGLERDLWGVHAVFQYIGKAVFDFQPLATPQLAAPFDEAMLAQYVQDMIVYESESLNRKVFQQQKAGNHALLLTLSRSFAHETLRAELSGYYNITSEEYLFRPRIGWNISDGLSAAIGASVMGGPEQFIFHYSKDVMNGVFAELRVGF